MPGHTHEDIDQYFSVLSRHLKLVSCWTYEEFVTEVYNAFKSEKWMPLVLTRINLNHDFQRWLAPFWDNKISGFGQYRVYR